MQINYTRQQLLELATRAEEKCARLLARRDCMPLERALTSVLLQSSESTDSAGLDKLLEQRREAQANKQISRQIQKEEKKLATLANRNAGHFTPHGATTWRAWFDGSALPNPGKCRMACVLQTPEGQRFDYVSSIEYGDSCDAEYGALILALTRAIQHQVTDLQLRGDSQVVIDDYNLRKVSELERMRQYRRKAHDLGRHFEHLSLCWIPRQKNQLADALTQLSR